MGYERPSKTPQYDNGLRGPGLWDRQENPVLRTASQYAYVSVFFSPDRRELISRNFRRVFCFCTSGKTPPQKFEFIYFTKVCLSIYETKIFIVNYRYIYLIKKIVNYLWAKFEQKRSYIRVILPKRVMVPEIKSWHNLISTVSPPKIGNKSTFEL